MPRAPMWPPTVLRRAVTPASEPTYRRKGMCDVADHVQLPGDAGAFGGYGRVCGHVAEFGCRYLRGAGRVAGGVAGGYRGEVSGLAGAGGTGGGAGGGCLPRGWGESWEKKHPAAW